MRQRASWIADKIDREYRRQKKWEEKIAEDRKRAEKCFGKQEKK